MKALFLRGPLGGVWLTRHKPFLVVIVDIDMSWKLENHIKA